MILRLVLIFCLAGGLKAFSQLDTIRIMQYNLLFFPENNNQRGPLLNRILEFYQPDIVALNELTDISAYELIANATPPQKWSFGPWYPDALISNGIMYNSNRFGLVSSFAFQTLPRKTHVYKFYNLNQDFATNPDTVYLTVLSTHFKSSQGSSNENTRLIQAIDINDYIRVFNPSNMVLTGDFNMYSSSEPAYQKLIEPGNDRLEDPLNRPGNWSNNSSFADVHTQSPRTLSFDGGVTGGLDDRFDFILLRPEIMQGTGGYEFIPGSYTTPGNDTQHFNRSILAAPVNSSAPDSIIQALHDMSDHLPVFIDLKFDPSNVTTAIPDYKPKCNAIINYSDLLSEFNDVFIYNLQGEIQSTNQLLQNRVPGLYFIVKPCAGGQTYYSKLIITEARELLFSRVLPR